MYDKEITLVFTDDDYYPNQYVALNMAYNLTSGNLYFIRYKGKDAETATERKSICYSSFTKQELIEFCESWIQNLKEQVPIQYEELIDEHRRFVKEKYDAYIATNPNFGKQIQKKGSFKWKMFKIRYHLNDNLRIHVSKKYQNNVINGKNYDVALYKIEDCQYEYANMFYLVKYRNIRDSLNEMVSFLRANL